MIWETHNDVYFIFLEHAIKVRASITVDASFSTAESAALRVKFNIFADKSSTRSPTFLLNECWKQTSNRDKTHTTGMRGIAPVAGMHTKRTVPKADLPTLQKFVKVCGQQ